MLNHFNPLMDGKEGGFSHICGDAYNQAVHKAGGPLNNVKVAKGYGIKGSRIDADMERLKHPLSFRFLLPQLLPQGEQQKQLLLHLQHGRG